MRLHQILTGSCNGDHLHVSHGTLNEFNFIAYASGCDVIILNENFVRIQIIPGVNLGNRIILSVSCSNQDGKIAVANPTGIYIFSPRANSPGTHPEATSTVTWCLQKHLDGIIPCSTRCLAWSRESFFSERPCGLLTACHDGTLTIYQSIAIEAARLSDPVQNAPRFSIGCGSLNSDSLSGESVSLKEPLDSDTSVMEHWEPVWTGQLQGTPQMVSFSPDGRYFATLFKSDEPIEPSQPQLRSRKSTLIVWFRNPASVVTFDQPVGSEPTRSSVSGSRVPKEKWEPIILPHPCSVVSFSWRARSRFIPFGWIPNVLLTSAEDRVCRVWVEMSKTPSMLTPADSNHNTKGRDSTGKGSKYSALWTHTTTDYPATITITLNPDLMSTGASTQPSDVPQRTTFPLPPPLLYHPVLRHLLHLWLTDPFTDVQISIESVQTRDSIRTDQVKVPHWSPPRFAFATAISTEGLNPVATAPDTESNTRSSELAYPFELYWLNNKVYRFDQRVRSLLMDTIARIVDIPILSDETNKENDTSTLTSLVDHLALIDQSFAVLLGEWQHAPDVVMAINPEDGSLVVWYIHGLDMSVPNPSGIHTHFVRLAEEFTGRGALESAFTSTPNLGARYSQVTASLRSRLHEAFPLGEAQSLLPGGLFAYLTTSPVTRHHWHFVGVAPCGAGGALSNFMHRAVLSMLFCRLLVLHNALQLIRPRSVVAAEVPQSTAGNAKGRQSWMRVILAGMTEAQLIWTALDTRVHGAHYVALVTRHVTGSLRQWRMDVSDSSHFQWIVSVNGSTRLSGHRFHTEAIVSHPLLPLVLTTSHYVHGRPMCQVDDGDESGVDKETTATESHSELILWSVGPVGPLTVSAGGSLTEPHQSHCSHEPQSTSAMNKNQTLAPVESGSTDLFTRGGCAFQGGLFEVARIDVSNPSQTHTWFDDLAWFPCMLTTSLTPYPVALFVGNVARNNSGVDSEQGQLGCFLAFADPGAVLSQALHQERATGVARPVSFANSGTAGCLVHLQAVLPQSARSSAPSFGSGQFTSPVPETLLFHVFPSDLIPGSKADDSPVHPSSPPGRPLLGRSWSTYLIVRLTRWSARPISSPITSIFASKQESICQLEMWRVHVITEAGFSTDTIPDSSDSGPVQLASLDDLLFGMEKVCDCQLPVPLGVSIVRAEVSAAHVSWAALSTYNAPPPYLIISACSDGCLRFWRCECHTPHDESAPTMNGMPNRFRWCEWQMPLAHALSSSIELEGEQSPLVLDVDCAYSGRVAVAYVPQSIDGPVRVTHLSGVDWPKVLVAIYECESSGGCEWILEDTIDLSPELHNHFLHLKTDPCVQLDWVSTEDGGHLLSVMLGSCVLVYAATCLNVSNPQQPLQSPSTLMTTLGEVYLTWRRVATTVIHTTTSIELGNSSDSPSPGVGRDLWVNLRQGGGRHRRAIWLRDGLLLVGAQAEMHVYSQWPSDSQLPRSDQMGAAPVHASNVGPSNTGLKDSTTNDTRLTDDTITAIDQSTDSAVTGSASMNVARLAKTYSAYLLKPSPSSALLTSPTSLTPGASPINPAAERHPSTATKSVVAEQPNPSLLANLGLFESIQFFNPVLPQFHPRQLLEWMNLGHLRRVQAILAHLTRCLAACNQNSTFGNARQNRVSVIRGPHRLTQGSFSSDMPLGPSGAGASNASQPSGAPGATGSTDQGIMLEAQAIPPLPLYVLLAVDALRASDLVEEKSDKQNVIDPLDDLVERSSTDESNLFKIQDETDEDDEELDSVDDTVDRSNTDELPRSHRRRPDLTRAHGKSAAAAHQPSGGMGMWSLKPKSLAAMSRFRPEDSRQLAEYLTTRQLPGLSPLDQMYLLGIADLMANTHTETTDRLSGFQPSGGVDVRVRRRISVTGEGTELKPVQTNQGLDECGLRFLLTVQLYSYLSRTLPPARRAQLLSSGLTNSSLAWAYHSDAEEQLLSCLPSNQFGDGTELTWSEFKRYGCGWWIRSDALLRVCAEKIARTAFQTTKDPMEAVVFYLAMHKAKTVAGLFKTIGNKTLENFFRSDFEPGQPSCRQAKLNAFRLLSQHRYTQAAGLFLLAGCLDDAVRVCLDTLKDLQLAVVLVRLYTSTTPGLDNRSVNSSYPRLLRQYVITHDDPFLRSMAYWTLGDPLAALQTLLEGPLAVDPDGYSDTPSARNSTTTSPRQDMQNPQHPQSLERSVSLASRSVPGTSLPYHSVYPSVFKFYTFLRSHPLVLRQWRLNAPTSADALALQRLLSLERRLYFRTAHHYSALGCPTLALEVLTKLPPLLSSDPIDRAERRGSVFNTRRPSLSATSRGSFATIAPGLSVTTLKPRPSETKADENVFTWSAQDPFETRTTSELDQFKIEWSDNEEDTDEASQNEGRRKTRAEDQGLMLTSSPNPIAQSEASDGNSAFEEQEVIVDLIANQLKFIACLKILAEELSTLAAGAESEGVSLRQHVWHWLEHELAVVNVLTAPGSALDSARDASRTDPDQIRPSAQRLLDQLIRLHNANSATAPVSTNNENPSELYCTMNRGPLTTPSHLVSITPCQTQSITQPHTCLHRTLDPAFHQTASAAAAIFLSPSSVPLDVREAELDRMRTRIHWLRSHKTFLTSLINFCGLYGASGVGLPAVRTELLLLLTELYTCPTTYLHSAQPLTASGRSTLGTGLNDVSGSAISPSANERTTSRTVLAAPWPSSTIGLIDGIPLLRTTLHLPPGALLLPDPVKHIQCMIHDLISCLETLPPPYLTTAILPCPYHATSPRTETSAASVAPSMKPAQTAATSIPSTANPYCAQCAWAPTPHRQRRVFLLRNLCAALAVCLHQCLSTGGWFGPGQTTQKPTTHGGGVGFVGGIALPASATMTARSVERLLATGQPLKPNTEPSRWPGIAQLSKYIHSQYPAPRSKSSLTTVMSSGILLASSAPVASSGVPAAAPATATTLRSVNRRYLVGLLAQALASTYLGLLVYALHTRDSCALYRLASARLDSATWSKVFGGTYRAKPIRPSAPPVAAASPRLTTKPPPRPDRPTPLAVPALGGARARLSDSTSESGDTTPREHGRGSSSRSPAPDVPVTSGTGSTGPPPSPPDEWFVPPQCSILTCLLERPAKQSELPNDPSQIFDSDDSEPPDDSYDTYADALAKQQRRVHRLTRRMERNQVARAKREAQRRAKEALRRRLAHHAGVLGHRSDEDEEDDAAPGVIPTVEELYPELVEEERRQAELAEATKRTIDAEQPRRWILRRLHFDPDFGCAHFDSDNLENAALLPYTEDELTNSGDEGSENEYLDDEDRDEGSAPFDRPGTRQWEVQRQWAAGDSFAWRLMRLGLMQLAKRELERLVQLLDFGSDDLAVHAPGLVTATRLVDMWMTGYRLELTAPPALTARDLTRSSFPNTTSSHLLPPPNFLPGVADLELTVGGTATTDGHFESTGGGGASAGGSSQQASQLPSVGATRAMMRLRHLIDPSKTPFQTRDPFSLPVKRLWCHLVRQPNVDDLITRHVFRKPRLIQSIIIPSTSSIHGAVNSDALEASSTAESRGPATLSASTSKGATMTSAPSSSVLTPQDDLSKGSVGKTARYQAADKQHAATVASPGSLLFDDAIRLIHKEQDPLIAMCVNQVNHSCIAIATPKEVIELNVDNLITLPAWYSDEVEYDLELMRRPQPRLFPDGGTDDFIVIDSNLDSIPAPTGTAPASASSSGASAGSGGVSSGAHVMLKRTLQAVYSLASHPTLPYYISGTGTGSVHLFEWATTIPVVAGFTNTYALTAAGASGQFPAGSRGARVTALHFDQSGRRFGCGDADGNFGLWNIQAAAMEKPPYFRCNCHAKSLADFCFVGSSTLVATVGNGGGTGTGELGSSSHMIAGVNVSSGTASGVSTAAGSAGTYRYGSESSSSMGLGGTRSFGLEQNGANLTLWDTLLPPHRCGVIKVTDAELDCPCTAVAHCAPSTNTSGWPNWSSAGPCCLAAMPWMPQTPAAAVLSPRDRVVVVGTKRGDVCFVDLRKPGVLHSFNAHESAAVRTLCVDPASDCLITGGADGIVKIWRLSEPELITSFSGNIHHQGRGAAAAVAAAALFRGNQSAAIIAATNPGIAQIRLLPVVTGASLLHQGCHLGRPGADQPDWDASIGLTYEQHEREKHSLVAASTACRFLSCGADGGLRMRSFVVRPKPFTVA